MSADKPVTLISGARKGIGRALAEYYLEQGHQVIGCSRSDSDLNASGYEHVCLDVVDEAAVVSLCQGIKKRYGKLDNLLNNAGIGVMNHAMLTPIDSLKNIFGTNVFGTFLLAREAAKRMQAQGSGRIVNFTSVAVPLRLEGEAAYAASKAAVESLTRIMANEFGALGITVNAVGPTPVKTDLIKGVPKEKLDALVYRQAIARYGEMRDVINAVNFFLKPESDFVTGQVLYLGGIS